MDKPDPTASDADPAAEQPALAVERAASAEPAKPRTVGGYEILEQIGHGAMGVVYKARQPDLDRLVALKELRSMHASTPEIVRRFARESRMAGSLNHSRIVTVYQYIEERGASYIAMEYMPRGSLRPWVGSLSLAQLAGVLKDLLAGLAAVEPSGIVHRDLKPENVMVTDDGRVKITDFGIAKATQSANVSSFMTATGTPVGTPAYMAPEQVLASTVGPWTDLYSVGVMAYEQLIGHLPFHDSDAPLAIMVRHVNEPIPPVLDSRPDLDPSLSEWVARLLVKEPAERTQSASQAWEELEEIVLDLLGPRWRREARLPELSSSTNSAQPLTPAPAPLGSHSVRAGASPAPPPAGAAHAHAPPDPEVESGFLPYGRAPTGAEPPPAERSSTASEHESAAAPPEQESAAASAHQEGRDHPPPATARRRARASVGRLRYLSGRRVAAVALLTALMGAAGFALAPGGDSARKPTRNGGASAGGQAHGPSRAYAVALSEAMSKLNGVRATAGAQLAHARTPHAQAQDAQRLARAQEQAAAAVRKISTEPRERTANTAIATALTDIGRGYAAIARAARSEDHRGFDDGRRTVTAATTSLTTAFARLQKLGYRVSG
ncbi:MAG TPA: serine/threonine-protein kinase [Solirubrobacteraceae bacterium]|jgi:serine/threonine protein kinase|nr:serine/threonine-protein kinase [Solirubrobacteraceae bacterium]